jgi:hypothetical protein
LSFKAGNRTLSVLLSISKKVAFKNFAIGWHANSISLKIQSCIIFWQGCFKFRTSDPKVLRQFEEKNIQVTLDNYIYGGGKNLHYVETGNPDSPTIYFIEKMVLIKLL